MNITIETVVSFMALVSSAYAIYRGIRTTPHEVKRTDSDAVSNYEEAITSALKRANETQAKLEQFEREMEAQDQEILALKKQLQERDLLIDEWMHGIDLLIHQLSAMDKIPVWKPRSIPDSK